MLASLLRRGKGMVKMAGAGPGPIGAPVGSVHEVEIERLGGYGEGVARIGGLAVFVPRALPGEAALVKITTRRSSYARALLLGQAAPSNASADRVIPPCEYADRCGGCALMHMSYARELAWKRQAVVDALRRVGRMEGVDVGETVGDFEGCCAEGSAPVAASLAQGAASLAQGAASPAQKAEALGARLRYRNKAACAFDGEAVGFYEPRSHRVVDVRDCLLQKEKAMAAVGAFRDWALGHSAPQGAPCGSITGFTARAMDGTGEVMAVLATQGTQGMQGTQGTQGMQGTQYAQAPRIGALVDALKADVPGLVSVAVSEAPPAAQGAGRRRVVGQGARIAWGAAHVRESLLGCVFAVPPSAFFQVNTHMAATLFGIVFDAAAAGGGDKVLDLFCGVGVATTLFARRCAHAVGVEVDEAAAAEAVRNAALNGATNAQIHAGRAEAMVDGLVARHGGRGAFGVVVLDPPRQGCDAGLIDAVARSGARRVVYVSCEPQTMARDLARLCSSHAYAVERVTPVDMFARTPNVETVVALGRL